MQIAAAIQKGGPGLKPGIELMLSPQELGPVRLTFTQSETGVTVNVHADRAETLELLRRNIDSLAQEFLDIGYESAEFTFERRDAEARDAARSADMDDADSAARVTRGCARCGHTDLAGLGSAGHSPLETRDTMELTSPTQP